MTFRHPEHAAVVAMLGTMDASYLERTRCYFGGGTAVVLQNGEYRISRDVDFLCADRDGYRELRIAAVRDGARAFLGGDVETVRPFVADQYGIRGIVALHGQRVRFEIVREGRVELEAMLDARLGVPVLTTGDQVCETLMANADRCLDRALAYRDATDLGYLVRADGSLPAAAVAKAEAAYGEDIRRNVAAVLERLGRDEEARHAAAVLSMAPEAIRDAAARLRRAAALAWPGLELPAPPEGRNKAPAD